MEMISWFCHHVVIEIDARSQASGFSLLAPDIESQSLTDHLSQYFLADEVSVQRKHIGLELHYDSLEPYGHQRTVAATPARQEKCSVDSTTPAPQKNDRHG
ncbi:hypothetical protein [Diaphorobacter aerolatus]|uniref:Uncharacterized protein n=1 Tax=Diaphorobacter aerolatus TaxID=1288495 RepID=A0A7H0GG17_9BURK|nr:hypothetical protein [Diaphorobacter aerolatus]QNP47233.1 hypothetical protein H9K75_12655 [Diaphorobacter aerolatus]